MKIVEILRRESSKNYGTLGILSINKQIFCCTLEPADNENASNISSIPAGQYICRRYSSERYPNTFEVTDVYGRSYILFHRGNAIEDTAGCIVLGQYFGKLKTHERAVLNSGNTFDQFMNTMEGETQFHLTIVEHY